MSCCPNSVRHALARSSATSVARMLRRGLATEVQSLEATPPPPPPPPPISAGATQTGASDSTISPPSSEQSKTDAKRNIRRMRRKTKYKDTYQRTIETMPFQAYQLALDIINEDRQEKLAKIKTEVTRIANLKKFSGLEEDHERIQGIREHIEELKILADINNPRVKHNFDKGIMSMDKPIYRFLADREWRKMPRKVLMQRLTTMNVIPDVLPKIDPIVDVEVRFGGKKQEPGVYLDSKLTEKPPTVQIKSFDKTERLCTIAVVNPDVPNLEKDSFDYRLHWMVSNIKITPTTTQAIGIPALPGSRTYSSWLPPHVQMGAPYHRFALLVFEQSNPVEFELEGDDATSTEPVKTEDGKLPRRKMKEIKRLGFNMRSFQDKHGLTAIGAYMWRGQWDENTKEVMIRNNLPGWDIRYERNLP